MKVAVRAIRANRSMSNKTGLRDVTLGHACSTGALLK